MSDAVKAASPGTSAKLLTTSTPSTPAAAGTSAGGSSTGSTILLQTPPPAFTALSAGQIIRAVTVGRNADGTTLLDTRFGQLAFELPFVATRGQVLRLQIVHAGLPLEFILLSAADGDEERGRPMAFTDLKHGTTLNGRFQVAGGPATGNAQASNGNATAPSTTGLNLRVLSVTAAGKAMPVATGDELLISGTVSGNARGGGTVLQTATGTLLLPTLTNAPKGAQVTFQILGTPGTILPATPAGMQAQSISYLAHGWTALQEAIVAVQAGNPAQASNIIQNSLPTTGPQLAAGIGFFLNAVFGARMQDWMSRDLMRALEAQRRGDLSSRLADDFAELTRLSSDSPGNDWRTVLLPLMHNDALHQIRLYLRAHRDRSDQTAPGDEDAGTRFVVEVELSRLGALQLDGLVRSKRFDLMVRTHQTLPDHVREEIGALFTAANASMKAAGQIAFQVTPEFPVSPLEPADVHTVGLFA